MTNSNGTRTVVDGRVDRGWHPQSAVAKLGGKGRDRSVTQRVWYGLFQRSPFRLPKAYRRRSSADPVPHVTARIKFVPSQDQGNLSRFPSPGRSAARLQYEPRCGFGYFLERPMFLFWAAGHSRPSSKVPVEERRPRIDRNQQARPRSCWQSDRTHPVGLCLHSKK